MKFSRWEVSVINKLTMPFEIVWIQCLCVCVWGGIPLHANVGTSFVYCPFSLFFLFVSLFQQQLSRTAGKVAVNASLTFAIIIFTFPSTFSDVKKQNSSDMLTFRRRFDSSQETLVYFSDFSKSEHRHDQITVMR